MSNPIIHSKSITEIRAIFGLDKPTHPLITVLDTQELAYGEETFGKRCSSDLNCVALKDSSCEIDYGRNSYDFDDGVLIFIAPKQIITGKKPHESSNRLDALFSPRPYQKTAPGLKIDDFNFFNYEVHEALYAMEGNSHLCWSFY